MIGTATSCPCDGLFYVRMYLGCVDAVTRLIALMNGHGQPFYAQNGSSGIICKDDVVIIKVNSQWDERGGTNSDLVKALVQAILDHPQGFSGEVVINAPTKFWKSNVDMKSNRLVLKITDAKPMIDWFDTNVDSQIVYLTRHPIPQSLSCIRNDWTLTVDAHLNDPAFVETNLSDVAVALAHDVMRGDNTLQQFVLNWALENVAPMRVLADRPAWVHVRYEDCVTNPEDTLALLADRLHLTDLDRMRGVLAQPSQSSRRSTEATRADIEAGRGADTVTRWRDSIDDDDERRCNELLEAFGIDPRTVLPD